MIRAYFENFAGEAVSISRKGFNPLGTLSSQRLTQSRNLERKIRVFDERVGPQRRHELFFRKYPPAAFHQKQEKVEGFRRQGEMFAIAGQETFGRIQAKRAKFVHGSCRVCHLYSAAGPLGIRLDQFYPVAMCLASAL